MRWYINDASLQGQFNNASEFLTFLSSLLECRNRFANLRLSMHLTRSISDRPASAKQTLRQIIMTTGQTELRRAFLFWLDRRGPFLEDDRFPETDDYFECKNIDVTETGLGEATRRVKAHMPAMTFSFSGGALDFAESPLQVQHGIPDDPLGNYLVGNIWDLADLANSASNARPAPTNWESLILAARELFPRLNIPDAVFRNPALSKEPFDGPIADRTLALLNHLNDYVAGRNDDGSEGPNARAIIDSYFTGDRALFSGESPSNQDDFSKEMTFPDPDDGTKEIFAHWHGKISHRFFRLHFEWPLRADETKLKILYLGPKITKK